MAEISPMRSESKALAAFGPADLQLNRALTQHNRADHVSHLWIASQEMSRTPSLAFTTSPRRKKIHTRAAQKKWLHLILSLYSDKATRSAEEGGGFVSGALCSDVGYVI